MYVSTHPWSLNLYGFPVNLITSQDFQLPLGGYIRDTEHIAVSSCKTYTVILIRCSYNLISSHLLKTRFISVKQEIPVLSHRIRLYLMLFLYRRTDSHQVVAPSPRWSYTRGAWVRIAHFFPTSTKLNRIQKRCHYVHCGLSPRPLMFFNTKLVSSGFRGFPEFGSLATTPYSAMTRWLYHVCYSINLVKRTSTLWRQLHCFPSMVFVSTIEAATCC
jgi:hypothetical protein